MPSPGAFLSTPGDRQHVDKQAFPWDSFQSTPGDRLHRGQTSLPLAPIWVCQETDYRKTNESSPGAPHGGPGDRLHKDRQVFPRSPSQSTGRQTTYRRQAFHWDPSQGAPEDRLHIQVFPGTPFGVPQRTDYKDTKVFP